LLAGEIAAVVEIIRQHGTHRFLKYSRRRHSGTPLAAGPETITTVLAGNLWLWSWIPGSLAGLGPRNDAR
jgi:hypothetical protein